MCLQFAFPLNKFKVRTDHVESPQEVLRNYFHSCLVSLAYPPAAKDSSLCVVEMKKYMYFAQYIFTEESRILFHFINTRHFIFRGNSFSVKITIPGTSKP